MSLGSVVQLWRYPVKSMAGERLAELELAWRGIPGDRGWAIYDETRGGITSAKRLASLRACHAHYPQPPRAGVAPPPALVTLPDGARFVTDSPEGPALLGALVGRPVSLRGLGSADSDAPPRLTLEGESEDTVRALHGLLPGEPMPDFSAFPPERLRQLRHGNFFDAYPLHLLTTATLRTLARVAPESTWDVRRFRPNLVVECDEGDGYPELGWIGRRVRIGTAVVELVTGCPRCVVVTQAAEGLPADPRVMRTLVRETRHTAGVYARVIEPGTAREGDPVAVAD